VSRQLTLGAIAVLGVAGGGLAAPIEEPPCARIELSIRDTADVPADVLARAQLEMALIYRDAGIELAWPPALSLPDATGTTPDCRFTIVILSHAGTRRLLPRLTRYAVGMAVRGGRRAYVLYPRVEQLSGGNGVDLSHVLGIAMAHELGHLLMPGGRHSQDGLMSANWNRKDLVLAQRSQLLFTAKEGELLRRRTCELDRP
jgi:hypothetical protein